MRTRIIILILATAFALTSCGLNSPTGFDGQAGSVTSKAEKEAKYVEAVHDEVPDDVLDYISEYKIVEFGESICDRLDNGDTRSDVYDVLSETVEKAETDEELLQAAGIGLMAELAMDHLCPELS
jgi:hypothetical protein